MTVPQTLPSNVPSQTMRPNSRLFHPHVEAERKLAGSARVPQSESPAAFVYPLLIGGNEKTVMFVENMMNNC